MTLPGTSRQLGRKRGAQQRGAGLVELLVASLLLAIGMMALVQVWSFAFTVTTNTDDRVVSYNLGRQAVERVKMAGFFGAPEGTTTTYYTGNQVLQATSAAARYAVSVAIASDTMSSGTSGTSTGVPAVTSLRTVTVTVTTVGDSRTQYQTTTYLVRAGI